MPEIPESVVIHVDEIPVVNRQASSDSIDRAIGVLNLTNVSRARDELVDALRPVITLYDGEKLYTDTVSTMTDSEFATLVGRLTYTGIPPAEIALIQKIRFFGLGEIWESNEPGIDLSDCQDKLQHAMEGVATSMLAMQPDENPTEARHFATLAFEQTMKIGKTLERYGIDVLAEGRRDLVHGYSEFISTYRYLVAVNAQLASLDLTIDPLPRSMAYYEQIASTLRGYAVSGDGYPPDIALKIFGFIKSPRAEVDDTQDYDLLARISILYPGDSMSEKVPGLRLDKQGHLTFDPTQSPVADMRYAAIHLAADILTKESGLLDLGSDAGCRLIQQVESQIRQRWQDGVDELLDQIRSSTDTLEPVVDTRPRY